MPQFRACVPVVRLSIGPGLTRAVEECAGRVGEGWICDQPVRGLDAFFEGVETATELGEHHLGWHIGSRMQTVDGDLGRGQLGGELEAGHDLSELALAVGPITAIAVLEHKVTELEGVLPY